MPESSANGKGMDTVKEKWPQIKTKSQQWWRTKKKKISRKKRWKKVPRIRVIIAIVEWLGIKNTRNSVQMNEIIIKKRNIVHKNQAHLRLNPEIETKRERNKMN